MKTIKHISGSLIFVLLLSFAVKAQDLDVVLTTSSYAGGYGVSCSGAQDGSLICIPVAGVSPYTFLWSNSSTTQDLYDLAAGTYSVTVTDSTGSSITAYAELLQADPLTVTVTSSDYNGYGVSVYGGNNGWLSAVAAGGTPSYGFEWSTTDEGTDISELQIGDYSVTVYDMNGCSATNTVTLNQPDQLQITGLTITNVSCAKAGDGSVAVSLTGGVGDYSYIYTSKIKMGFDGTAYNLSPGNYHLYMWDGNGARVDTIITVTEPDPLRVSVTGSHFDNMKEISVSCDGCADAWIQLSAAGGTGGGFVYDWDTLGNEKSVERIWTRGDATFHNLSPAEYFVRVTDSQGCKAADVVDIYNNPSGTYWKLKGNINVNPDNMFMGTNDSSDFVMKTSGSERMRIDAKGQVGIRGTLKLDSLVGNGEKVVVADSNGVLRMIGDDSPSSLVCNGNSSTAWYRAQVGQDDIYRLCGRVGIGVKPGMPTRLDVLGGVRIGSTNYVGTGAEEGSDNGLLVEGSVGIGTTIIPSNYKLIVEGQIGTREVVVVKPGDPWPDYVFKKGYQKLSLNKLKEFLSEKEHLPGMPDANEIEANGQPIGKIQLLQQEKIEELYLYVMELDKKMELLKNENEVLKTQIRKIASKK